MWPPAAPLVPLGTPSGSQAATAHSASDSPRNPYLHDGLEPPARQALHAPFSDGATSQAHIVQSEDADASSTGQQHSHGASSSFSFPIKTKDGEDDAAANVHADAHPHPQRSRCAPDQQAQSESEQLDEDRSSASRDASMRMSGHDTSQDRLPQRDDSLKGSAAHLSAELHGKNGTAAQPKSANHKTDRRSGTLEPTDFAGNSIGKTPDSTIKELSQELYAVSNKKPQLAEGKTSCVEAMLMCLLIHASISHQLSQKNFHWG